MAHCKDLTFEEVHSDNYLRVAIEVIRAIKDEPNYGEMKPVPLTMQWLTFAEYGLGAVFGAKDAEGRYVGSLFGLCSQDPLTGETHGTAYMWGVAPGCREGGTARTLREMFESWAKKKGAVKLNLGVHETPRSEQQREARERDGYTLESYSFTKRID